MWWPVGWVGVGVGVGVGWVWGGLSVATRGLGGRERVPTR